MIRATCELCAALDFIAFIDHSIVRIVTENFCAIIVSRLTGANQQETAPPDRESGYHFYLDPPTGFRYMLCALLRQETISWI